MLAYVFWHQRNRKIAREEYLAKLTTFHQTSQEQLPQGLFSSMVLEVAHLPRMEKKRETYEDWYILKDSASLDS